MGPINLFVFTIFKTSELVRRNCLKDQVHENNINNRKSERDPVNIHSTNENHERSNWSDVRKKDNKELSEVYDNRVFSTHE